ncbi:MAG: hypothetical protein AB7D47_10200 [Desulfovibrio sp.]|jgi:hypothetical protein
MVSTRYHDLGDTISTAPYVGKAAKGAKKAADAVAKGYNYLDKAVGKAAEPIASRIGPDKVQKGIEISGDLLNPIPPAQTGAGSLINAVNMYWDQQHKKDMPRAQGKEKSKLTQYWSSDWWGR